MRRISTLEHKIRGYVNNANLFDRYFDDRPDDEWKALCVSMNILGDTCLALEYYEASGIGDDYGEKYLKLYGVLQAIILQQDSICQIYRIFLGSVLQPGSDPAWKRIRNLRNLTVRHPVEKNDKNGNKRCFISRVSIENDSFQVMIWNKDKEQKEFEDINLTTLYEEYKTGTVEYLKSIYQAQIKKWGTL